MPPIRRVAISLARRRARGSSTHGLRGTPCWMRPMRSLCRRLRCRNRSYEERSGGLCSAHGTTRTYDSRNPCGMSPYQL